MVRYTSQRGTEEQALLRELALQEVLAVRQKSRRKGSAALRWVLPILCAGVAGFCFWYGRLMHSFGRAQMSTAFFAFCVVYVVLALWALPPARDALTKAGTRIALRRQLRNSPPADAGPIEYRFDETGVETVSDHSRSVNDWSVYRCWGEQGHYLYLRMPTGAAAVLVDRTRLSPEEKAELLGLLVSLPKEEV
ncbi:MAG: YcxB family protein [Clostridiales bacterium]|nr:YcxB family protein [Clostridiales bacterium]